MRATIVTIILALRTAQPAPAEPMTPFKDRFNRPIATSVQSPSGADTTVVAAPPKQHDRPPRVHPCPEGMVHIRGGHFDRRPVNDFCLDTHEVTVGEFAEYVATLEADAQRTKKELAEFKAALSTVSRAEEHAQYSENCTWRHRDKLQRHPMNCVTVRDAEAFCQARGKRLPTGREWQWAARDGKKAKKYPWGGQPPSLVRLHMATDPDDRYKRTQPVGQYEPTESGLYDLAGNVWEWTACAHTDPSCTSRGGGFRTHDEKFLRVAFENTGGLLTDRSDETGFRCAANIRRPPRAKQRGTAP